MVLPVARPSTRCGLDRISLAAIRATSEAAASWFGCMMTSTISKPEIRRTKSERNPKTENSKNSSKSGFVRFPGSLFFRHSSFGFRHLPRILFGAFGQREDELLCRHLFFQQRNLVHAFGQRQ